MHSREAAQKRPDIWRRQDDIVELILREAEPRIHFIEEFAGKIRGQADFIVDAQVVYNLDKYPL